MKIARNNNTHRTTLGLGYPGQQTLSEIDRMYKLIDAEEEIALVGKIKARMKLRA
jgi:hypothetical protein